MRYLISAFAALAALTLTWPVLGLPAWAVILTTGVVFGSAYGLTSAALALRKVKDSTKPDISEGYTPEYVKALGNQIRRDLIVLRSRVAAIAAYGADEDGEMTRLMGQLRVDVEKVLKNLELDPDDISQMGLQLETIGPLARIITECHKHTVTGIGGDTLEKSVEAVKEGLMTTSEGFSEKHERVLNKNDLIRLKALVRTVERLNESA